MDELDVTAIGDEAFQGAESLRSVILPGTIVSIGSRAFADCPSLKKVVLPASLGHLRDGTFAECKSLGYLLIPDGVKSIGDEETRGEGVGVFSGCSSLATIVIGKGVTSIADNAFDGCEALALIYTDNEAIVPRLIELLGAFINIQPVPTPFRVAIQTEYGLATRSVEPSEELIFGLEAEAVTEPAPPFSPSYNLAFTDGEVALSTDVRVFAESTTWTVTAELSAHSTLTLDWVASAGGEDDTYSMPEEYEFTLTRGEESLDMRNETSILLDNSTGDETRKFSFTITVTHIEEGPTVTCNLAQGWNLIGIPFELDASSVLKLNQCMTMGFDASVQTYVHSNLEYAPGSGIWLFTEKAASLKLKGTVVEQAPPLEAGWNLVSPLYGEDTLPDGATEIWYWTSGSNQPFQYGDKANPGTGYWFLKK